MNGNPFLGVFLHWLGGLAAGSFYVPYRRVRNWSWETYWLVGGFFSWIVMPWLLAFVLTRDLPGVLQQQSSSTLAWTFFFGALWGIGGLSFGLSMRYLGMSLGMGVALGYCAAFGTLLPPIAKLWFPEIPVAEDISQITATTAGKVTLAGVGICLLGIFIAALAGLAKERGMTDSAKKSAIREFNFSRGILTASFSGILSACFSFGLTAGAPLGAASLQAGTPALWSGLPKLVIVLLGGFTTNFIWCAALNIKNKSGGEYFGSRYTARTSTQSAGKNRSPTLLNYFFCFIAGATWYFQFFFYTMGETQMGKFGFASWTLHMASIIIFSTIWGWILHEWKGSGARAYAMISAGIATLIISTIVIGLGSYLKQKSADSSGLETSRRTRAQLIGFGWPHRFSADFRKRDFSFQRPFRRHNNSSIESCGASASSSGYPAKRGM